MITTPDMIDNATSNATVCGTDRICKKESER